MRTMKHLNLGGRRSERQFQRAERARLRHDASIRVAQTRRDLARAQIQKREEVNHETDNH